MSVARDSRSSVGGGGYDAGLYSGCNSREDATSPWCNRSVVHG